MSFFKYLQEKYRLVEAVPQVTSFRHNLDNALDNRKMYDEVLKGQGLVLKTLEPGVSLRAFDTCVAVLDEREGADRPVVFVYLFELHSHLGKSACLEKYLWKDDSSTNFKVEGLSVAHYVFFYLVDKYSAVVSDQKHTAQGATWWKNTVGKALARGLDVFAENEFATVVKVKTESHFQKLFDLLWGDQDKFQLRRLIVAKPGYYEES